MNILPQDKESIDSLIKKERIEKFDNEINNLQKEKLEKEILLLKEKTDCLFDLKISARKLAESVSHISFTLLSIMIIALVFLLKSF